MNPELEAALGQRVQQAVAQMLGQAMIDRVAAETRAAMIAQDLGARVQALTEEVTALKEAAGKDKGE